MEMYVTFLSGGETVAAVLHLPERTPAPGVIMCHGFTGHKAETHRLFVHTARDFCHHGLAVLRFDFRGSGDSAGEFRDMTISREIADAQAGLGFLSARGEVDGERLGVLGLSMGGCVSACLAGRDDRVKALVLWAALAHPGRIFERLLPSFGEVQQVADMNGWDIGRGFLEDARALHPLKEIRRYQGRALIVHGTRDESVPPSDAEDYHKALTPHSSRPGEAPSNAVRAPAAHVELHFVKDADHVFSSLTWKEEVITKSRQFFVETLEARPGCS